MIWWLLKIITLYMGGGLIGLNKINNNINGLTDLCEMIDDVSCPENDSIIFIEEMKNAHAFSYFIMFSTILLLISCKRNKPIVAIKLLEIYDSISEKHEFYVKLFSHTDENKKTALNYAVNNNMKQVVLNILELKKKHKQVNNIIDSLFYVGKMKPLSSYSGSIENNHKFDQIDNNYLQHNKIKLIPFKSKFSDNEK